LSRCHGALDSLGHARGRLLIRRWLPRATHDFQSCSGLWGPPMSGGITSERMWLYRDLRQTRRAFPAIWLRNHRPPPRLTPLGDSAPGLI
jgi:hypothetical protein